MTVETEEREWAGLMADGVGVAFREPLHLNGDVRVVSRENHVLTVLPPLHQSHGEGKDLAQEDGDAAGAVHLAQGRDLDDRSSTQNKGTSCQS